MDRAGIVVVTIYGVIFLICIVLIVFLIFRRIRIRKQESFEKRDN